jgi:Zn-dependent protease/predicted transcriptional regulator
MAARRWTLLRLFGFEIRFDLTWLILFALVIWTLSAGYFPEAYGHLSRGTYLWMAVIGAIGLIASIVIHELSHSLVARRFGMRISGITLFAFGGAAELEDEPPTAWSEFLMAAAGPAMSLVLALVFWLIAGALAGTAPTPFVAVVRYLAGINVILALFNCVPAFPLDGGRMLRAALWGWRGDVRWATRIASNLGGAFGIGLIVLGVVTALGGNLVGGMWYALIGLFVRAAAASAYQQLVTREVLGHISLASLMTRDPVTAPPETSIADLVDHYFLARNLKLVPVVANSAVVGVVDVRAAKAVPRQEWESRRIADIMTPLSPESTIQLGAGAAEALAQMQRTAQTRLLVMDGTRLAGILSLSDILRMIGLRLDLDASSPRGPRPGAVSPRY